MITVRRDPQIKLPEIVTKMMATERAQTDSSEYTTSQIKQTDVYGVMCPLLSLNGVVVDMPDLIDFELDCTGVLPEVYFEFKDRNNIFTQYNTPTTSNELQVQIIPPVEATYKKINMLFYVTEISVQQGIIIGRGVYKIPGLITNRHIALGEMTTYELCDFISAESQLGFASNVAATNDKRYIYCDYKNYGDLLKDEIANSSADETHVYDCWVDLWNYITLCDIFERYNTIDEGDSLVMWIADHNTIGAVGEKAEPVRMDAILTNHPAVERTELFVRNYRVQTDNEYVKQGTQKAVTVYNMQTKEYVGHYVADGDVDKDKYINLEYGGEVYGEYDYIFSKQCRDMFLKKMGAETIELTLTSPVFGLSRGDQCRFVWLDNDPRNRYWRETFEKAKISKDIKDLHLGWLEDWVDSVKGVMDNSLYVNLQVSGQYTVVGMKAIFEHNMWLYQLMITRPAERKPQLMVDLTEDTTEINNGMV